MNAPFQNPDNPGNRFAALVGGRGRAATSNSADEHRCEETAYDSRSDGYAADHRRCGNCFGLCGRNRTCQC